MRTITRGAWAHRDLVIEGPTVIEGGNLVGANIVNPGRHDVVLRGGNLRGLMVDGVALTGPADHPPWLHVQGAHVHYMVPVVEELSDETREFVARLRDELGEAGARLWRDLVDVVHARGGGATAAEALSALAARITADGAPYDAARFVAAVRRLSGRATWPALRAYVLAHRPETWRRG